MGLKNRILYTWLEEPNVPYIVSTHELIFDSQAPKCFRLTSTQVFMTHVIQSV